MRKLDYFAPQTIRPAVEFRRDSVTVTTVRLLKGTAERVQRHADGAGERISVASHRPGRCGTPERVLGMSEI